MLNNTGIMSLDLFLCNKYCKITRLDNMIDMEDDGLLKTNTLAYFPATLVTKKKSFNH